ncbi:MAG: hypothetical protein PHI99_11555 [Syntrophales bacterium]|nr:hypothetical protein [Syntrophales bacterium]
MKKIIGIIFLFALLAGCATAPRPTAQQINSADYGPAPENYEEIIKAATSPKLLDPYSAQYTFSKPTKRWNNMVDGIVYGWRVGGTLNAKNRMGGYVGAKPFYAFIKDGAVIRFICGKIIIPDSSLYMGMMSGLSDSSSSFSFCED